MQFFAQAFTAVKKMLYYQKGKADMKRGLWILLLLHCLTVSGLGGETGPGTRLYQIQTRFFHILYPRSLQVEARRLAGMADTQYERIQSLLQRRTPHPITVLLTDDYQGANGYSLPVPFNHIVLYAHPSRNDSVIAHNPDYLEALFIHELTHAISLTIRGPLMEAGYRIFGSWVLPQMYMMPGFMIEGVTVSFESLEGYGRVNLPVVREELVQDSFEGRFKTLSQASGSYDIYPGGRIIYHYGGLFSHYLQTNYGMDKYRELWQRTGRGNPLLLLPLNFKRTYQHSLRKSWEAFKTSLKLPADISTNRTPLLSGQVHPDCLTSFGDYLYYHDSFRLGLYQYHIPTGKEVRLSVTDDTLSRLAVSPDGRQLLVSRSSLERGKPRLLVQLFDLSGSRWLPNKWTGVREAHFYQQGIIAIRPRGFETDLVYLGPQEEKLLLKGSPLQYFGQPSPWEEGQIIFTLRLKGEKHIAAYHMESGSVTVLLNQDGSPLSAVSHIRELSAMDGQLFFSWNDGNGMSRWASLKDSTLQVYQTQYPGGSRQPVAAAGKVYGLGLYAQGRQIHLLPRSGPQQSLPVRWESLTLTQENVPQSYPESPYLPLSYLRPHVWAPSLRLNGNSLQGLGLLTYLSDPMRNNILMAGIDYSLLSPFVNMDIWWDNSSTGFPWRVSVSDRLLRAGPLSPLWRETSLSADIGRTWFFVPVDHCLHTGLSIYHSAAALISTDSPYSTPYQFNNTVAGAWVRLSALSGLYPFPAARGMQLSFFGDTHLQSGLWKWEAQFIWTPQILPLYLTLHSAWIPGSYLSMSGLHPDLLGIYGPVLPEYSTRPDTGPLYLYASARWYWINLEIQQGLGAWPFYVNRIYSLAGYRAGSLLQEYYHSLYLQASLDMTLFQVIPFRIYGEVYYAWNDQAWGYRWGIFYDSSFFGWGSPENRRKVSLQTGESYPNLHGHNRPEG